MSGYLIQLTTVFLSLIISGVTSEETYASYPTNGNHWNYPKARRDASYVDRLHGYNVTNHYGWLEDLASAETKQFVKANNDITQKYLNRHPDRALIQKTLETLYNVTVTDAKRKAGNYSYWTARSGLQGNKILYRQFNDGPQETFVDPNVLAPEETGFIQAYSFSNDEKHIVYHVARKGSDWKGIFVRTNDAKAELVQELTWSKDNGVTWSPFNNGFFYTTYPTPTKTPWDDAGLDDSPALNNKLWYHTIGKKQSEDQLIAEAAKDSPYSFGIDFLGDDSEWAYVQSDVSLSYADTAKFAESNNVKDLAWKKIYEHDGTGDNFSVISNGELKLDNKTFLWQTSEKAPYGKVVKFHLDNFDKRVDYLPEQKGYGLNSVKIYKEKAVASYSKDGVYHLLVFNAKAPSKPLHAFRTPVGELKSYKFDKTENVLSYSVADLIYPSKSYEIHLNSTDLTPKLIETAKTLPGFPADRYEVEQLHYPSKDGTIVPMTFAHPKGLKKNGKNPILLFGYGGFAIFNSGTPKEHFQTLLQLYNVSIAIPHIRGGSENGEPWHTDGVVLKKQNSYDDFQWAAKYLVKEKYTTHQRIIANGRSNGGVLTAVTFNQAPTLFGGFVADVGVLDLVRYQRFTYGTTWYNDFGDINKKDEFVNILKYSPYHNVQARLDQPPLLITTGTHDDRVSPHHNYKFAAKVQYLNPSRKNPALLATTENAGHGCGGCGKPVRKEISDRNNFITFIATVLKIKA